MGTFYQVTLPERVMVRVSPNDVSEEEEMEAAAAFTALFLEYLADNLKVYPDWPVDKVPESVV
jgi:hypothetical protein